MLWLEVPWTRSSHLYEWANDVMYMPLQPCKLRSFLAVVQGERNCCTCVIIVYELWRYTVPFFSTVSDSFDGELGWKCLEQDPRTFMSEQMSLMSTCIAVPVPPAWIKSMMYAKVCGMWSLLQAWCSLQSGAGSSQRQPVATTPPNPSARDSESADI